MTPPPTPEPRPARRPVAPLLSDTSAAPVSAKTRVLNELRRRLRRGDFQPGQPIRQDALARELGVSRLPIREALQVLQAEELVTYSPNRGYATAQLDLDDLAGLYRIRELLEAEAVRQKLPVLDKPALERMSKLMAEMERVTFSNSEDMVGLNRSFHFELLCTESNKRLDSILDQLWDQTDRYRALYFTQTTVRAEVHREHRKIYQACVAGDVEKVIRLLHQHRTAGLVAIVKAFAGSDVD